VSDSFGIVTSAISISRFATRPSETPARATEQSLQLISHSGE
jgi:hypothetical protein